ncbi:unnamed protein product [Gongylonema pulchrum]|uniref:Protein kinase domain-containing protein n=1 Tax=Gongylonema pulchrum TaxID=637853 RepID=A0A183E986_9BILA|nr:unnamed protein product [Gongylonema pulchrum]
MKMLSKSHHGTNCTVVYLDKCMSQKQCSRQCLVSSLTYSKSWAPRCCVGFIQDVANVLGTLAFLMDPQQHDVNTVPILRTLWLPGEQSFDV